MERFKLAKLAKARGIKRDVELQPLAGRLSTEREYARVILGVLAEGAKYKPELIAAAVAIRGALTRDDDRLGAILRAMRSAMGALGRVAGEMIRRLLSIEAVRHDGKWMQQVNAAIGVDLRGIVKAGDVAPFIDLATERSVSLIQGLTDDVAKRVGVALMDMITAGKATAEIAKGLEAEFRFGRKRALLIARDQAAKFNGSLNRIRQEQAGVTSYTWWTVQDERVRGNPSGRYPTARPSHWDRHGEKFRWSDPPAGGNPGEPVNCRCIARPVLEIK